MFNSINSFKLKRQKTYAPDQRDQIIYAQLVQTGKDFEAEVEEVQWLSKKKLDEEIVAHREKWLFVLRWANL